MSHTYESYPWISPMKTAAWPMGRETIWCGFWGGGNELKSLFQPVLIALYDLIGTNENNIALYAMQTIIATQNIRRRDILELTGNKKYNRKSRIKYIYSGSLQ